MAVEGELERHCSLGRPGTVGVSSTHEAGGGRGEGSRNAVGGDQGGDGASAVLYPKPAGVGHDEVEPFLELLGTCHPFQPSYLPEAGHTVVLAHGKGVDGHHIVRDIGERMHLHGHMPLRNLRKSQCYNSHTPSDAV